MSEVELSERIHSAFSARETLEIAGGGTRSALGHSVAAESTISSGSLSGVIEYKPGELTLVAGAGTPLAEIEDLLNAENQQFNFEPPDHRALFGSSGTPSLGGAVATGASGPRRLRMGACRDALLGVNFIDGTGQIHRAGGRVMKNVTGYDLTRLQCGAFGTLGLITEIALKVMPKPEREFTLALHGLSDRDAVAAMAKALAMPVDVSAAAHVPVSLSKELGFFDAVTLLRIDGFESQAAYRRERIIDALGAGDEISSNPWPALRDVMVFAGDDRAVWRVSLPPMRAPEYVSALSNEIEVDVFYDWGGGLLWLACDADTEAHASLIRRALAPFGGHATLFRASDAVRALTPVFQPEPAPLVRMAAGLKEKFDPASILNPGRMGS